MGTGIERPAFLVTPLAEGLAWRGDGTHRFEEKIDGVTHILEVTGRGYTARLWGEKVRGVKCQVSGKEPDTSHPAPDTFYAVDVLEYNGENLRDWPRRESLKVLDAIMGERRTLNGETLRPATGSGGEFLEAVLVRGGEGVVASLLDQPFAAPRWKCKRVETFYCVVTEKHPTGKQSVRLGAIEWREVGEQGYTPGLHGEVTRDRGWLPLFGVKFDQCRVGSVLKVEGCGLTAEGKIREPRVCKDSPGSWLVKY